MEFEKKRKVFSAGEWLTLVGMAAAAVGCGLTWANKPPDVSSGVAALYVSRRNYAQTGFELRLGTLPLGWVVVAAALVCGALLLVQPTPENRGTFLALQVALGVLVVVLALLHVGPYAGVLLALLGGLLLIGGGLARFR